MRLAVFGLLLPRADAASKSRAANSSHTTTPSKRGTGRPSRMSKPIRLYHGGRAVDAQLPCLIAVTKAESSGHLSCLSARPPDLATATAARPEVACVPLSYVPFI